MTFKPMETKEQVENLGHPTESVWQSLAAQAYQPGIQLASSQGERASKMDQFLHIPLPGQSSDREPPTNEEDDEYVLRLGGRLGNGGRQLLPHFNE